jgi:ribosomal protein L30/L7E
LGAAKNRPLLEHPMTTILLGAALLIVAGLLEVEPRAKAVLIALGLVAVAHGVYCELAATEPAVWTVTA